MCPSAMPGNPEAEPWEGGWEIPQRGAESASGLHQASGLLPGNFQGMNQLEGSRPGRRTPFPVGLVKTPPTKVLPTISISAFSGELGWAGVTPTHFHGSPVPLPDRSGPQLSAQLRGEGLERKGGRSPPNWAWSTLFPHSKGLTEFWVTARWCTSWGTSGFGTGRGQGRCRPGAGRYRGAQAGSRQHPSEQAFNFWQR